MNFNLLIILWLVVQIPFVIWLSKGKPPAPVWRKYPFSTRLMLAVPGAGWRRRFAAEDIPVFERFRVRVFVQWGVMMGTYTLLYLYMFFVYR